MITIPEIDPSRTDEQGRHIARSQPGAGGTIPLQPVKSPLDLDNVDDITSASGLGGARNLSKNQFPELPKLPGEAAAPEAGAGEAAGGAAALEELLPLAALA